MIDEMVSQGEGKYTDEQIIDQISQWVGIQGGKMTGEEATKSEEQVMRDLRKRLRKEGKIRSQGADQFVTSPEMQKFEDFQERAGKMMY